MKIEIKNERNWKKKNWKFSCCKQNQEEKPFSAIFFFWNFSFRFLEKRKKRKKNNKHGGNREIQEAFQSYLLSYSLTIYNYILLFIFFIFYPSSISLNSLISTLDIFLFIYFTFKMGWLFKCFFFLFFFFLIIFLLFLICLYFDWLKWLSCTLILHFRVYYYLFSWIFIFLLILFHFYYYNILVRSFIISLSNFF